MEIYYLVTQLESTKESLKADYPTRLDNDSPRSNRPLNRNPVAGLSYFIGAVVRHVLEVITKFRLLQFLFIACHN